MRLNVDNSKVVQFADRLESLSKTGLQRVVKETLSKSALHVKQKTMPKSTERAFTIRKKNFFKANSRVEFAKLGRIDSMKATVGFIEGKLKGDNNFAVRDLEQQEFGGRIKGRKFIPLDSARTGKNRDKPVKRAVPKVKELKSFGVVAANDRRRLRGSSKKQKWIRAAFRAGQGGFVLGLKKQGRQTLSRIDQISSNRATGKLEIKRTAVYSYKKGGIKPVKSRGFMRRAVHETGLNMDDIFINEARKQIEYLMYR